MSRRIELLRRARRWLLPAALLAFVPKCVLCLAGYFGLGVALGLPLAAPEFCGGAETSSTHWPTLLALTGFFLGFMWWLRREVLCSTRFARKFASLRVIRGR